MKKRVERSRKGPAGRIRGGTIKSSRRRRKPAAKSGHWVEADELARLQDSLREAQETLQAIRSGEVDAVVVNGKEGHHIYSLTGADQPYRVYVERMQEGAVTISSDGLILFANRRFAEMVNQPLDRVIGAEVSGCLAPAAWKKICTVFTGTHQVVKCETLLGARGRKPLPVNLTASHLPLPGQNVLCLVVTDLSEHKANEGLRFAKEVAEKANAAKDSFLAALSHELRTPLNPVLLLASEAAENPDLPPKVRADFATICTNIELEARLIDDLLDLTRISSGKLALELRPVDAHAIIESSIAMLQTELDQKRLSLQRSATAASGTVSADPVRLQQIIWNVLKNAVKFTPHGGEIRIETSSADGETLNIVISDTGIGMTPGEMKQIFEPFAQGEHASSRGAHQFGGLGLGLAISRRLAEAHGGSISAFSEGRNQGSRFTITLQVSRQLPAMQKPRNVAADVPGLSPEAKVTGGLRILLVEDHAATRAALSRLLNRRNHEVQGAGSIAEARSLAQDGHFDLVISDIGLPDGSGYDLMEHLNRYQRLPGVALTGYGMDYDIAKSRTAGFLTHLTKPIRADELEAAIARTRGQKDKNSDSSE